MTKQVETREMFQLIEELFPIHRSMTGQGVRATFDRIAKEIPLSVSEIPTGTKVFDWIIPKEWQIHDAFVADVNGRKLIDYSNHNLHVVNDSIAVDTKLPWNELDPHLHSLPDRPDSIPYRTTYFSENWGFCLKHSQRSELARSQGDFHVKIDAKHFDGSMSIAECVLPGAEVDSVLIYCHTCHPSLANDNLSGIAVATQLAKWLQTRSHRLTYRFVFAPATIGAIAWLAGNVELVPTISHGLILSLLGSHGRFTYKRSRQGKAQIDSIAESAVRSRGGQIRDFSPFGYDERQFCSPGFNLPVGCLSRTPHAEFPEYHTSDDNLSFISADRLAESLNLCQQIIESIEAEHPLESLRGVQPPSIARQNTMLAEGRNPVSKNPKCEPYLRKHNLHRRFGERDDRGQFQQAVMWVLNLSDGFHSVEQMAARSKLSEAEIVQAVSALVEVNLLEFNAPAKQIRGQ